LLGLQHRLGVGALLSALRSLRDPPAMSDTEPRERPPRAEPDYDPAFVALNREMEAKFLRGEISFSSFDWHLRSICGV
jgi:hypothetical protein